MVKTFFARRNLYRGFCSHLIPIIDMTNKKQAICKRLLLVVLLSTVLSGQAHAFCFEEAGREYGIAPQVLWSIAKNESNLNPAAINQNANGTYDFGLMQINTIWAKTLGKERWASLGDACTNVKTGAWILRQCIDSYGYGWKAIGCYNSRTPSKRDLYANKIAVIMEKYRLFSPRPAVAAKRESLPTVTRVAFQSEWDQGREW